MPNRQGVLCSTVLSVFYVARVATALALAGLAGQVAG